MYFQDEASDDIKMYYVMCVLATGRMSFIHFFFTFCCSKIWVAAVGLYCAIGVRGAENCVNYMINLCLSSR